jgi:hypothetical protein
VALVKGVEGRRECCGGERATAHCSRGRGVAAGGGGRGGSHSGGNRRAGCSSGACLRRSRPRVRGGDP